MKKTRPTSNPKTNGKTLLTDELIERLVQAIAGLGMYKEEAATFVGISKSALSEWIQFGTHNPDSYPMCVKLVDAIEKALVTCEARDLQKVDKAGEGTLEKGDWRAAAWRLERRFPKRWGRKAEVEVSNPDGTMKPIVKLYLPKNGRERKR